jgi:hypothetical protein
MLRPDSDVAQTARFVEKCRSYRKRWPHLRIEAGEQVRPRKQ